jgi:hypothetical protein
MPINITMVQNKVGDKVYDNVANIGAMRPKDAAACPPLQNGSKVFDLDNPDMEVFNSLPEWIRKKIMGNLNYAGSPLEALIEKAPKEDKKEKPVKKDRKPVEPADDTDDSDDDNPY